MRDRRHDHPLDLRGLGGRAEHAGDRVTVDVGVEHTHRQSARGHRCGEVDGDRRLADTTLAGGHRVDTRERPGLGERDDGLGGIAAQRLAELGALLVAHHVEGHAHLAHTGDVGDGLGDAFRNLGAHGASGRGQIDRHIDAAVGADLDALDHSEIGDGLADLRVLDRASALRTSDSLTAMTPMVGGMPLATGYGSTTTSGHQWMRGRSAGLGSMPVE